MNLNEYQSESRRTAIYPRRIPPIRMMGYEGIFPDVECGLVYPTIGLVGESGEFLEKVKKIIRDKEGFIDDSTREKLLDELGDILWYLSQVSFELNYALDGLAERNLKKLRDRQERMKLQGEGDNR